MNSPFAQCPIPENELQRLHAVHAYDILDTLPEIEFDTLTRIAMHAINTPAAVIGLMDADRLWFKSQIGLGVPQLDRKIAFCAYAIMQPDELLVVEDLQQDSRLRDNPLVTQAPYLRFYAGAPLINRHGYALGTIAVVDTKPRKLSETQVNLLKDLSALVITALENRTIASQLALANSQLDEERARLADRVIERTAQLEKASRAKSEFLAGMNHELRTPLNAILGFGQLLEIDTNVSTEQRESVSHILAAGHQLLELINDLLDFSQIDIGKLRFNIKSLSIANIAASCVAQVELAVAKEKKIVIENTLTDAALRVLGDNLRVRQALINLLTNAVKYNRDNGRVTLSSRIGQAGRLQIEVRDTGIGIAGHRLPLLFTPFERVDQKHGAISGLGIGLHITKQLVEGMGGTVGAASELGKGSTFWFELPLAKQAYAASVAAATSGQPMLQRNTRFVVLYIEDNPMNVRLVKKALQSWPGIELLIAGTAEEGLTIAEEAQPDLILMDIRLPGIDGVTATTILKDITATRDIPVVALSAAAYQEDIERALNAGCNAYLTKPLEFQALYELIDIARLAR